MPMFCATASVIVARLRRRLERVAFDFADAKYLRPVLPKFMPDVKLETLQQEAAALYALLSATDINHIF